MHNYNKQIESLRDEIICAIHDIICRHNLTEVTLPDTFDETPFVVVFDDTPSCEPHECAVRKVAVCGTGIMLEADDKITGETYTIDNPYSPALNTPEWLNGIYMNIQKVINHY